MSYMTTLKNRGRSVVQAFREALICLALGLRESLRLGVLLRSSGLCLLVFAFWSWVFATNIDLIAVAAGLLSLFVTYGGLALGFIPHSGGSGLPGIPQALGALLLIATAMTVALILILYSGSIVLTIRIALHWLILGRVRKHTLKRYPKLLERPLQPGDLLLGTRYHLGPWMGLSVGTLLCLLVPVLNGTLLLMLFAYLNVRFLTPAVLSGLSPGAEQLTLIASRRGSMTAFGVLILLLALVPVVNLLLPALLSAGTCHLCYRALNTAQAATGTAPSTPVSLPAC